MLTQNELKYFKDKLEEMKIQIQSNLDNTSLEMHTLNDTSPKDEADHASFERGQSMGNSIIVKQSEKLQAIDRGLSRIADGTYGICDSCDEPIYIERLKVKIFADYCISCREIIEKENAQK